MYFCILNENYFKPIAKQKYIEIEQCHEDSLEKIRVEIANATIYDKLDKDLFANPNDNYEIMSKILQNAENLHMLKKIKKFNKCRHRKEEWMTNELLVKVVRKMSCMLIGKLPNSYIRIMKQLKQNLKIVRKEF